MSILNYDNKELKKLEKLSDEIIGLEEEMAKLSDENLSLKTFEFCKRLSAGESLDDILVEVFAVCREVSFRVLGKKHYKVQLMGGIAIHQGRVVEMKTGEGKTLTELCPAYLNALTTRGVHIITVNDYLAKRDKEEMEPFFRFLKLSVGLVIEETENRRFEYRKDIVYTTNNEIGFDYLKDNLVRERREKSLRRLNYAIIDEIDSILIDEARTPLIISAAADESTDIYKYVNDVIKDLDKEDYEIDFEDKTIVLSESGMEKVEKKLSKGILANTELSEFTHLIGQALRANYILKKDKDYIIENGEVILIDENTGRIANGRRLSNGLHQCIEAKEGVEIKGEDKTLATITYQNLFSLYNKISGMSGTVKTEEEEFKEIYNLDVVVIPTNNPVKRIDNKDLIYKNKVFRNSAIIQDIIETKNTGRPVLVGTLSINESEKISKILTREGIKHNLLTAKNKEEEAKIISRAGERGAVTISTNMAGRGTDIKVSKEIDDIGGLKVIGVGRAESIRIDNQLIGRTGRQGNNGTSQFYISLRDDLIAKNSKKNIHKLFDGVKSAAIRKEIFNLQRIEASKSYESRKEVAKYNEAINRHRGIIYRERDLIVFGKDIRLTITNMMIDINREIINEQLEKYGITNIAKVNWYKKKVFFTALLEIFSEKYNYEFENIVDNYKYKDFNNTNEIIAFFTDSIIDYFNELIGLDILDFQNHVRNNFLVIIDENWVKHLKAMELLRQRVKNQAFNQRDPMQVYNKESLVLYNNLIKSINDDFIEGLFKVIIPSLLENRDLEPVEN
ncbi:MAG: preprotein translocase subunit SecA [Sarcina sp.]